MILTYDELLAAKRGITKLLSADIDIDVARPLTKALRQVVQELEVFDLERMKLVKKFAKHDEKGNPVNNANGEPTFETPEQQKECHLKFAELLIHPVDVTIEPFDISQIHGVKIGAELFILEKLQLGC